MADSFGLKIGLEGEKEFKKALADINQSFKVLGSEMKLATSQFDKNDKSVEALAARTKVLRKEIDEQTTKIDTLRKALQNAATSFGENDRRTQNWQRLGRYVYLRHGRSGKAAVEGLSGDRHGHHAQRQACRHGTLQ